MITIITEKPSQARNFAKALGGKSGTFNGQQYTIVPARGHLYEFIDPDQQVPSGKSAHYRSWDIKNLPWDESEFAWKRGKKKDVTAVLKEIKDACSKSDKVYLGGDLDPSGEGGLISIEILDELGIRNKEFRRMEFLDESPKSIQEAFKKAKLIPDLHKHDEYLKAIYRTKFDFLTMQFTRIATACGNGRAVLRQGRLKSAMVLITGDGLKAVKEYKKIPFYQNRFKDEKGNTYTSKDEPSFPDKAQVPQTYRQGTVTVDKKEIKKTAPPKLLDLAGLSSMLAGKGYKAKDVLATYQKMYECTTPLRSGVTGVSGVLSYPRTEDLVVTPEQFDELLPYIDDIAGVVGVDVGLLTHRMPRKTHVKTGGAHGANRPGTNVPVDLAQVERQFGKCGVAIYEVLARNYLAMLCEDYEYESQSGHVTEYPAFTGSCSVPMKQGWKQVFQSGDDEDDDGKGLGTVANPFIHEGFPPKPPTPTMKWLMKQLEKHDVGTGATRTSTYSEVTNEKSKYPLLEEKRGKITLTEYGEMSYRLLPGTHIGSLELTEEVQSDMRMIADGKLDGDTALKKIQRYVIEDIDTMTRNGESMRKELGIVAQESSQQAERWTGKWKGKEVSFKREWGGHRFTDDECEKLCAGEEISVFGLKSKTGSEYGVTGKLSKQSYNGHSYVGFERTGFAADPNQSGSIPAQWCGHKFTQDEISLLEMGKEVYIEGFVSKKTGKEFNAKVVVEEEGGRKKIVPKFN